MCRICGRSLARSVYQGEFKSCPQCSRAAGRHAYYPLAEFGERYVDGKDIPQSWCPECRGGDRGAPRRFC